MQCEKNHAGIYVCYRRVGDIDTRKYSEVSRKGRELLAYILRTVYGISGDPLPLEREEHGKPYLKGYPGIHFNISHSGQYVMIAFSDGPVGVDIQEMTPDKDLEKLAKRVMSDEEYVRFLEAEDRTDSFFRTWVKKEAYIKRTGDGLFADMRTLPMDGFFREFEIDPDYRCAVCAECAQEVRVEEITL